MQLLKDYFSSANCVEDEYSQEVLNITSGTVPLELRGTLFRNGNGRFEHYGVKYQHLFDGDGMVLSLTFQDGKITYNNKYVQTDEWQQEAEKKKFLYRGFGTNRPGGLRANFLDMRFKNVANTSVIYHADKLLALWEGGIPHEIDPSTLETVSRFSYDGALLNKFSFLDQKIMPELPFSAHPKIDQNGTLHNFGTAAGLKNRLLQYEVTKEGQAKVSHVTNLGRLNFTHDFVLTVEGYKVFFLTPVKFDLLRSFMGLATPAGSMQADSIEKVKIMVLDPEYNESFFETDFSFIFHFINGYLEDDTLVVDGLMLEEWPSAQGMQDFLNGEVSELVPFTPTRYAINLKTKAVEKKVITNYGMEFPEIHPSRQGQNYRYAWGIAAPLVDHKAPPVLDGILKLDTHDAGSSKYLPMSGSLPGEPIFVPIGDGEDQGYLIFPLYNGDNQKTEIRCLDAATLESVFIAEFPHNIPLGFHGIWVDSK